MSPQRPDVSVVVASHRPDYVGRLLSGLEHAVVGPQTLEVIVVHDYPLDRAAPAAPGVRWIHHGDRSIPAKRNRGIAAASAPVIAFIDDDCKPMPGWASAALSHLRDHADHAGVEGKTVIGASASAGGSYGEFRRLEKRGYRTNNIFYRREALERVGGFDERFSVQREDLDLAFSVMETGGTIGYSERIVVEHAHRPGERWDVLKNCINRRFDPLLHKKHPRRYRQWVGSPFTPTIGSVLVLHAACCILLAAAPAAGCVGVLADGALVCAAAMRKHLASGRIALPQLLRECAALAIAPFVLAGALIHGSVRFRTLLLF